MIVPTQHDFYAKFFNGSNSDMRSVGVTLREKYCIYRKKKADGLTTRESQETAFSIAYLITAGEKWV